MRFGNQRESGNIEDRRGGSRVPGGGIAVGGIGTIIVVLLGLLFGVDPSALLNIIEGGSPPQQQALNRAPNNSWPGDSQHASPPADDPQRHFVAQVLGSTEDTWRSVFQENGRVYQEPRLVLFFPSASTRSARLCAGASGQQPVEHDVAGTRRKMRSKRARKAAARRGQGARFHALRSA